MTLHATQGEVRDPRALWWWMRAFVLITLLGYIATFLLSAATWGIYARLVVIPVPQARLIDQAVALVNVGVLIAYIFSIFFTLRVTYRLMKNAHTFGGDEDLMSPGMAVGWYFVPFASLFQPPRAVGQIWRATFRRIGQIGKGSSIVGWWWMSWIVSGVLLTYTSIAFREDLSNATHDAIQVGVFIQTLGFGLRAMAAALLLATFGMLVRAQSNLDSIGDTFD